LEPGVEGELEGSHHHLFDDPARGDPCPHILEVPCEVADRVRQLPRRINALPVQNISLEEGNQKGIL